MTENFENMIAYQRLDIALRKMIIEFNKHPDKKRLDAERTKFNDVQAKLDAGSVEAQTLAEEIEKIYTEFKATEKTLDSVIKDYEAATDEEKAKFLPQLESLKSRVDSCKNKISSRIERIKRISSDSYMNLNTKKAVKDEFDKIKKRLDEYKLKIMPDRDKIEGEMKALESKIDGDVLSLYKKAKSEGVALPVFVPATGDNENNYACGGCGMLLSQTSKSELKSKNICQCETCRRLIYRK